MAGSSWKMYGGAVARLHGGRDRPLTIADQGTWHASDHLLTYVTIWGSSAATTLNFVPSDVMILLLAPLIYFAPSAGGDVTNGGAGGQDAVLRFRD